MFPLSYFPPFILPFYFSPPPQHNPVKLQQLPFQSQQLPEISFENKLEHFINRTREPGRRSTSLKYMKLSQQYSHIRIREIEEFQKFYRKVVRKYEEYYEGDRRKKSWGKNDVVILIWVVHRLAASKMVNPKEWQFEDWVCVSELIPFRTAEECKFKWLSMRRNQLKSHPWTVGQISDMFQMIQRVPRVKENREEEIDWNMISQQLFYSNQVYRTGKQCRQCWNIQTKSHHQSKKLWTKEEDEVLVSRQREEGRRWKAISSSLPGRSENAIKNRFNLLSSKGSYQESVGEQFQIQKQRISEHTDGDEIVHRRQTD